MIYAAAVFMELEWDRLWSTEGDTRILLWSHLPIYDVHGKCCFSPVIKITVNHFTFCSAHMLFSPFLLCRLSLLLCKVLNLIAGKRNCSLMCTSHVMGQELIYLVLSLEPPHCSSDYQPLLEQFDILHLFLPLLKYLFEHWQIMWFLFKAAGIDNPIRL